MQVKSFKKIGWNGKLLLEYRLKKTGIIAPVGSHHNMAGYGHRAAGQFSEFHLGSLPDLRNHGTFSTDNDTLLADGFNRNIVAIQKPLSILVRPVSPFGLSCAKVPCMMNAGCMRSCHGKDYSRRR